MLEKKKKLIKWKETLKWSLFVTFTRENNEITVWNNGKGIPVVEHKDEKMYVPTMIFGHLLTSSNYNDEEEKVTGGRNGYGAKLCNIFSTKFTVETACKEYKRKFKQVRTIIFRREEERGDGNKDSIYENWEGGRKWRP